MSEHDGTDDPYRTRPDQSQPYGQQPYGQQPYGGLSGPVSPGHPVDGRAHLDLPTRPPSVVRLVQVMLAGAVAALLQGVYAAFVFDDALAAPGTDLEGLAAGSGMDPARFADLVGTVFVVVLVVMTLLTVGLWLLFARLFDRGAGRVAGTVLGAVNGSLLLVGLLQPGDLLGTALSAIEASIVVAALVLLWRPATSAWFGAVAASRGARG